MSPISEVSEVPARPANSNAVMTGPSSLIKESAAAIPSASSEPNRCSRSKPCSPSTMPTNKPESITMISERAPAL